VRETENQFFCLLYGFLESVSTEKQPLFDKILIANRSVVLLAVSYCILILYVGVKSLVE
jgi:hypothetical protein